jgi:hypothetical protein
MEIHCLERDRIERRIGDAIQELYRIRGDHKSPKIEHALALEQAMEVKRQADRELNDHVRQHGCKR